MRLCSLFLLFAVLLVGTAGCFPRQGRPVDATPDQLMHLANNACRRHDPDAWQMLLTRLADKHPATAQGQRARQILADSQATLASCQRSLQAAETHD